jgi:lipoate-protein ligase A
MVIRLIEAGTVSHLRSQTIYHGLAYARTEETPPTIVLATPGEPYVCVGFHQNIEAEVDLAYCSSQGLPVLRRETGGGAVYLDSNQLFVQWIMGRDQLPARVERRFELFLQPLVETYRAFGIDAQIRPINDVHVDGRKIVGTGAAHIGNAEVMVGNFIFDFDKDVMTRILNAPSPAFRQQVRESLEQYMTSTRQVSGKILDPQEVAAVYIRECAKALGKTLEPGSITASEQAAIELVDQRFCSDEFKQGGDGLRRPGVKIHEDVYVAETSHNSSGLRVTARIRSEHLESITIDGPDDLSNLCSQIRGLPIARDPITHAVRTWLTQNPTAPYQESTLVDSILDLAKPQPARTTP